MNTQTTPDTFFILENDGEIQLEAFTLMGASVKENQTPIGLFGTGTKYALTALFRDQIIPQGSSGLVKFDFSKETIVFRGEPFQIIKLQWGDKTHALGYTTSLGQAHWNVNHALRELVSNTFDEGGRAYLRHDIPKPTSGKTFIAIPTTSSVAEFWLNRKKTFLHGRFPLWKSEYISLYEGPGHVYRRGVLVHELSVPSAFSYDFKELPLNEDRTASRSQANIALGSHLKYLPQEYFKHIVEFASRPGTFEAGNIEIMWFLELPILFKLQEVYTDEVVFITQEDKHRFKHYLQGTYKLITLPSSWVQAFFNLKKYNRDLKYRFLADVLKVEELKGFEVVTPTDQEALVLREAIDFARASGLSLDCMIQVMTCPENPGVLGCYCEETDKAPEKILVNREVLQDVDRTTKVLLHEEMHRISSVPDDSDKFVSYFEDEWLRLAKLLAARGEI